MRTFENLRTFSSSDSLRTIDRTDKNLLLLEHRETTQMDKQLGNEVKLCVCNSYNWLSKLKTSDITSHLHVANTLTVCVSYRELQDQWRTACVIAINREVTHGC